MPVARGALLGVVMPLVVLAGCENDDHPAAATGAAARLRMDVAAAAQAPGEQRPAVRALAVLRRWDRSRAAAYASGDVAALRRLYAPGSWAGARDVRVLREYAERGLVVRGLRMQVLEAELLSGDPGVLRLQVVDRLARGVVTGPGQGRAPVQLQRSQPLTRVITFNDIGGRWAVRSVRPG